MIKRTFYALIFLIHLPVFAQNNDQPKLIVGLVIDQMKYEYIDKYWNDFGEGGFKRLVNEGFYCRNVNYNYKPTYTGPGHASIFSGATPSIHGIVGNNWYNRKEGRVVYCAEENLLEGKSEFNAKRMLSETIADQLKHFTNFRGKSYGISLKDRGAILPAGHLADAAYWLDGNSGKFISSNYYSSSNPKWLENFNSTDFEKKYLAEGWELSFPLGYYQQSRPDDNNYERPFIKGSKSEFPYNLMDVKEEKGWSVLKGVPQGNQMLADLAAVLLKNEKLGADEIIDFLSISFSATDYVGHQFGTQSIEVHDTYIKLDKTISALLTLLDEQVGTANYLLFLTSDHGASMPRNYLSENNSPNGRLQTKSMEQGLDSALDATFGNEDWIADLINLNIYFNPILNEKYFNQRNEVLAFSKSYLIGFEGVNKVVDEIDLLAATDQLTIMAANGFLKEASGELIIIEKPGWTTYSDKGSTHGSPYSYDIHVPLIFYGQNIKSGESFEAYVITDIATTVAAACKLPFPSSSQGKVITEVLLPNK